MHHAGGLLLVIKALEERLLATTTLSVFLRTGTGPAATGCATVVLFLDTMAVDDDDGSLPVVLLAHGS